MCIETYWHGKAPSPFAHLYYYVNLNVNLSHYIQHNRYRRYTIFKTLYIIIYIVTYKTSCICTYMSSKLKEK